MSYRPSLIPPETLLSFWIFLWSILYCIAKYYVPSVPLDNWNPAFSILVALVYQSYAFIQIILNVRPYYRLPWILAKFVVVTFLFKLFPLYLVIGSSPLLTNPSKIVQGILPFIVLFLIYFVYITLQKLDLFEIYDDLTDSLIKDDDRILPYRILTYIRKLVIHDVE
jgi:hypothetical protein